MKISDFQKLEESVKEQDFNKSFKNINNVMLYLSIFGHLASIFLAYFLVSKILAGAITDNPILVGISTIILLCGLEALKREIFDKFSLQQIKYKSITRSDVLPLMIVSLVIVSISFYSSIKGAQEFSSKSKEIDTQIETNVKSYEDSLRNISNIEIKNLKDKIEKIDVKIDEKDKEQTELSGLEDITRIQKNRIKDLKSQIKDLSTERNTYKIEIDSVEKKTDRKILSFKSKTELKGTEKKEENKDNSFFFVMISTIIELVILFGVYFNEYYKYRSYTDFKSKIDKDPNFQMYYNYNKIIDVIYNQDTKINDKLPSGKSIQELCKMNGVILLQKDISNVFKLFTSLGIIKASGSTKYFAKGKESAQEILKKHFNID